MRTELESTLNKPPQDDPDANQWDKIPFQIGWRLLMRSVSNPAHRTKTKIVGVLRDKSIIIETPEFNLNGGTSEEGDGDYICALMYDGVAFRFHSKLQQVFADELVFLDYPSEFEYKEPRTQERVKVNLKAELLMNESDQPNAGDMMA